MTAWRPSHALVALENEVTAACPDRDTASDGFIGDAAHQARQSDHNPDEHGIVNAWDCTTDPAHGIGDALAAFLLRSQDPRIKYVIYKRRIFDGPGQGHEPWAWRPYTGRDPHESHVHLSVRSDDPAPWGFTLEENDMFEPTDRDRLERLEQKLDQVVDQLLVSRDDTSAKGPTVRWLTAKAADRTRRLLGRR